MQTDSIFIPDDDAVEAAEQLLQDDLEGVRGDELPETALQALRGVLQLMADGQCVQLQALDRALTIQEAAAVTQTSVEHIRERIDDDELELTNGTIALADLLHNEAQRREDREEALNEMVRESQRLGLYDL